MLKMMLYAGLFAALLYGVRELTGLPISYAEIGALCALSLAFSQYDVLRKAAGKAKLSQKRSILLFMAGCFAIDLIEWLSQELLVGLTVSVFAAVFLLAARNGKEEPI